MARKDEALQHLLAGMSPSGIAKAMGVTVSTVMGYLYNQVGQARLHRSQILFSIKRDDRKAIESAIEKHRTSKSWTIAKALRRAGHNVATDDLLIYLKLRNEKVQLGDLYDALRDIELFLHETAKDSLRREFGKDWWRKGVPKQIRAACAATFE